MAEIVVVRRHAVGRGHRAQGADEFVGALVAHHAHGLDRQQHGEGLPDIVIEPGFADLVEIDAVRLAQDVQTVAGDLAGNADRQPGSGERVAADKGVRQPQLAAQRAHLVLEEFAQGLHQLHVHAFRQATHIVVRLDGHRRAADEGHAFDHIRVERALGQEVRPTHLLRLVLEDVNKGGADDLALLFGVGHAFELVEEQLLRIHMHQLDVVVIAEQRHHFLRLAHAHHARINEHAGELVADGLVQQYGDHG